MSEVKSDIEIARAANKIHIRDVAKKINVPEENLIQYGADAAKIDFPFIEKSKSNKDGKLIYNSDSGKEVEIDKDFNSKNNRSKETIKTTLEFYKNEISQHLGLDPDNIDINIRY